MATDDIPSGGQPQRLDSWKEIAEYLRRDVRTAMRWESQGLPLHRVGGTGRSVFAFTNEIDVWMAGRLAESEAPSDSAPLPSVAVERPQRSLRPVLISVAAGLAAIALGAVAISSGFVALDVATLRITEANTHISVSDAFGTSRVIHRFGPGAMLRGGPAARLEDLDGDGLPEILAMVAFYDGQGGRASASGEVWALSLEGAVRWRFAFDDAMKFAGGPVSGPWTMADWQAEPFAASKRVAVAAHDATWWTSVVAVIDHRGRRLSSFVNAGWVESVLWLSSERLAIGGFSNERDSAIFAMLDANRLEGQTPGMTGTEYACVTCPTTAPLFYATFARSELNHATGSRFNRAHVSMVGDRIVVTTVEVSRDGGDATALYEFDRDLHFLRARYSDTYWDEHARLERDGGVTHSREKCPDRNGPVAIHVWNAARGWVRTPPSGT